MEMRGCFVKLRLRMNYQEKREDIKLNKGGENFFFNGQQCPDMEKILEGI